MAQEIFKKNLNTVHFTSFKIQMNYNKIFGYLYDVKTTKFSPLKSIHEIKSKDLISKHGFSLKRIINASFEDVNCTKNFASLEGNLIYLFEKKICVH